MGLTSNGKKGSGKYELSSGTLKKEAINFSTTTWFDNY